MTRSTPTVICLPVQSRAASFAFYRDGLGFAPIGEPDQDGIPEPLQFGLDDTVRIMLIPTDGFRGITGGRTITPAGSSECVLTIGAATTSDVNQLMERARAAGASSVTGAAQQPWGYAGAFADPDGHIWMVRSDGHAAP